MQPTNILLSIDETVTTSQSNISTLIWPIDQYSSVPVPAQVEINMLPVLLRWGYTERGMILSQPSFRLPLIRKACKNNNIQLIQALSFRRTYIKYLNPSKSMEALGLGQSTHIQQSATLFEQAVATYLIKQGIPFLTEEDQKKLFYQEQQETTTKIDSTICDVVFHPLETTKNTRQQLLLTPDFIFNPPIHLCKQQNRKHRIQSNHHHHQQQQQQHTIHWLEVKMFYGASTIPQGTNNAVGGIIEKVTKYVQQLGPGAIVFAYGCGEELARELEMRHVQVLDSFPLDLSTLQEYQQTWCCNDEGDVLF